MYVNTFNGLQVGQVVTGYYKGFWKITKIDSGFYANLPDRKQYAHVYLVQVSTSQGKVPKATREASCCSSFCLDAKTYLAEQIVEASRLNTVVLGIEAQIQAGLL